MMSLLGDVNIWKQESVSSLTEFEAADAYNNQVSILYDICDEVASCVENSTVVQSALSDIIINNTDINEAIFNAGSGDFPVQPARPDDDLWGASLSLAKWVQTSIVDAAEAVQAALELAEALVDVINLPGLNQLAASKVATFAQGIADAGAATIIAEADSSTEQDIACWAFNTIRCDEGGVYSYDALFNNLIALTATLGLSKATYSTAVSAFFALQAPALFGRYWSLGLNDPSNDWSTICSNCAASWTETFDFTQSSSPWISYGCSETYVPGTGWQGSQVCIRLPNQASPYTITSFTLEQSATGTGTIGLRDANGIRIQTLGDTSTGTTVQWLGSLSVATSEFLSADTDPSSGNVTYTTITITGTGTNPF
jgi:hypothetical protein